MQNKDFLLTITELKKNLKQQTKEELINLLADCYKSNQNVKEFISSKFAGEGTIAQFHKAYRKKVHDAFFPTRGDYFKLSEGKKAITEFKKFKSDERLVLDLMLYYVEMGVELTNAYGSIDEDFYYSLESMYASVVKVLNKQDSPDIYFEFQKRLEAVMDNTLNIGWGFNESLTDLYYEIQWIEVEEE